VGPVSVRVNLAWHGCGRVCSGQGRLWIAVVGVLTVLLGASVTLCLNRLDDSSHMFKRRKALNGSGVKAFFFRL